MQQVAAWLEKLGMSEYAGRFAENRIDLSVLRDLTDQDLKRNSASSSAIARSCCARSANWAGLRRRHRGLRSRRRPGTPLNAASSH
jgi:SAM (Sterile alpha motif) domain-containing protein